MCGPIPRRRTPLAAYSEEHRCLLIAQLSADCPTRRGKRRAGTCHQHHRPERCGKYFRAVSGAIGRIASAVNSARRNVAHFTRPDHRSGFRPASVGAGEGSSVGARCYWGRRCRAIARHGVISARQKPESLPLRHPIWPALESQCERHRNGDSGRTRAGYSASQI